MPDPAFESGTSPNRNKNKYFKKNQDSLYNKKELLNAYMVKHYLKLKFKHKVKIQSKKNDQFNYEQ